MKRFLFVFSTLLILGSFCACSNSDEIDIKSTDGSSDIEEGTGNDMSVTYETSTDPKERIVGSWLLVKCNEDDMSSQNKVCTFMEDGTWTVSPQPPVSELPTPDVDQVVAFEDGWAYDADKDVISGYLDLHSPSAMNFPYRFELKRKELILSFEPRGMYFMPPTPMVRYYIRKY